MQNDEIKQLMREVLEERSRIPQDEHMEDHLYIRSMIARDKARSEFWQALAMKSLPGIIWSLIAAGATAAWHLVSKHVSWN